MKSKNNFLEFGCFHFHGGDFSIYVVYACFLNKHGDGCRHEPVWCDASVIPQDNRSIRDASLVPIYTYAAMGFQTLSGHIQTKMFRP